MIAVVIPCYKVKKHILSLLNRIDDSVDIIFLIDDFCPEHAGKYVQEHSRDQRIRIICHTKNIGVGGAMKTGYRAALEHEASIIIKLDGDGQMDPIHIRKLIRPIQEGAADYTKGNRFFSLESLSTMPRMRVFGNSILSFLNKIVSGYWNIMDPTNGYTAIHADILRLLPFDKIDNGYFFESDMLFRLSTLRCVVKDIPLTAQYGNESSSLSIRNVLYGFPLKYANRFFKRIFYNYFLRDFNVGTIELCFGLLLITFGSAYGSWFWMKAFLLQIPATSGTVMVAALPIIIGSQLLISAIHFDVMNIPKECIHTSREGKNL